MSIVKINAITVPAGQGDELARRFASRAGEVGKSDGFEEFQLLRPTDDRHTWLVYTRWRDQESFDAWMNSRSFARAHGGEGGPGGPPGGGHQAGPPPGVGGSQSAGGPPGHPGSAGAEGRPAGAPPGGSGPAPVGTSAELWSFSVEQLEASA
ncbi:MAG: antibiotic biosynthesis monooxygenase family protein [Acidimicrobiales bacterium]